MFNNFYFYIIYIYISIFINFKKIYYLIKILVLKKKEIKKYVYEKNRTKYFRKNVKPKQKIKLYMFFFVSYTHLYLFRKSSGNVKYSFL